MKQKEVSEILSFINEQIKEPTPLKNALKRLQRRKKFKEITYNKFHYHVSNLIKRDEISHSTSLDFHPKRKPIILIQKKTSNGSTGNN